MRIVALIIAPLALAAAACGPAPTCSNVAPDLSIISPRTYVDRATNDAGATSTSVTISDDLTTIEETFTKDGHVWRVRYLVTDKRQVDSRALPAQ